ncbi:FAD-binding oxidoreductase [Kribbella sandramycini]|uniref:Alkyldihydroxyacetonephosphate synthase n=1 Tax=Kribbella sandramycini TaxID=60450 RepID=A0A7Y4L044_9ACTN|nr:FAD-binding oxidoreductase [Kribbella sandramycini]MBB6565580.1 alkyldihydroxyacetonephosphate synthase [Kribbella sandramycini]NOL41844.1 FAD-binding oxidoreductase [Kribbella sandramycini]
MTESDLAVVQLTPGRWGDPTHRAEVPPAALAALQQLGVHRPPPSAEPVDRPGPTEAQLAFLTAVVGVEHVATDLAARWAHTRGYSTPDLLRHRSGDTTGMPDAVVFPGSHDEILQLLAGCAERDLAVVPYSGGTSVVGGLAASRRFVTVVDLRRLDQLVELDEISRTATLQAGVRGPAAEALLAARGYTLGHFPQSYEGASIGGYAAARSSGQASAGYGRFDQMVVGLTLATPRGTVQLGRAPMSAAGPDLRQLVLGSEGAFGVITSVVVRVRPRPTERHFEGWRFESFDAALTAVRRLAQDGPLPTVLRLSDEAETAVNHPAYAGSALVIIGFDGPYQPGTAAVLTEAGGQSLGAEVGDAWRTGRYQAPYLRDPLLDEGALVETLETATFWSRIPALKAEVTEALVKSLSDQGTPPLVMCHVSHVYETGASLYFTVVCAQHDRPVEQWQTAKQQASQAIAAAGGTISHHHGVGADHRAAYAAEIGPLGVAALQAVKDVLDPDGILNPGILI